jgi:hypothetical protein
MNRRQRRVGFGEIPESADCAFDQIGDMENSF